MASTFRSYVVGIAGDDLRGERVPRASNHWANDGSRTGLKGKAPAGVRLVARLVVFAFAVLACLAKGIGPVKAAYLMAIGPAFAVTASGTDLTLRLELPLGTEPSQMVESETSDEPVVTLCLTAHHPAPLASGYHLPSPDGERQPVPAQARSLRPLAWSSHPPLRPPRTTA